MRIAKPLFVGAGAIALVFTGGAAAQAAGSYPAAGIGSLSCSDGEVVRINVYYNGAKPGTLHYNISRTHEDTVSLPPLASGGEMNSMSVNTWSQSSSWNVWVDAGGVVAKNTSAECVPR